MIGHKISPKIWIASVGEKYKEELSECKSDDGWSVPSKSRINDLILFYHNKPESCIKDIFKITGEIHKDVAGEYTVKRCDYFAPIKRVARIKLPITFQEMKNDPYLSGSHMVLTCMNGRFEVTEYWDHIYKMIIKKNPELENKLSPYL